MDRTPGLTQSTPAFTTNNINQGNTMTDNLPDWYPTATSLCTSCGRKYHDSERSCDSCRICSWCDENAIDALKTDSLWCTDCLPAIIEDLDNNSHLHNFMLTCPNIQMMRNTYYHLTQISKASGRYHRTHYTTRDGAASAIPRRDADELPELITQLEEHRANQLDGILDESLAQIISVFEAIHDNAKTYYPENHDG
jgi:hypothetical protein